MIKKILYRAPIKALVIGFLLMLGVFIQSPLANAQPLQSAPVHTFAAECKDIKTAKDKTGDIDGNTCLYQKYINPLIRFISAIAGLAGVISIVIGGITYSTAGGDMNKVAAAKKRITQAVMAFLAFIFLLAFLQWIVPGGINGRG